LKNYLAFCPDFLQDGLQDIVYNIQLGAGGCIRHPNYRPMALQSDAEQRLQHLPIELQNRYLSLQLKRFLYNVYFIGSWPSNSRFENSQLENSAASPSHQPLLENNMAGGLHIEFYDQLHRSNLGEGYFDPGWLILRQEEDGSLAVQKQDLTLHIQRDRHLQKTEQPENVRANVGATVAVRLPQNLLDGEFYIAVGNAGLTTYASNIAKDEYLLVNLYFNLSPEGLISAMRSITGQLNALSVPFAFKAICDPTRCDRHNTGILSITKDNYETVRPILQQLYQVQQSQFRPNIPLFTKPLAPGLSLAEETRKAESSDAISEKFGKKCCAIVANALLEAEDKGYNSPQGRMTCILQHFLNESINLYAPYLIDTESIDTYSELMP
jgi:HopA1 effector protein family